MRKTITNQYLEALKVLNGWTIVSEWATKVGELYPDLLEKANKEAESQAHDTTGLRELAARISSAISRGAYADKIEIDSSDRPRKVRFISKAQYKEHLYVETEEDVAPLRRDEIVKRDLQELNQKEKYRLEEFQSIAKYLKMFNGLEFELDHAQALLNKELPGKHHPDNMQFLLKAHNAKKHNKNWQRFTLDEQIEYIQTVVKLQHLVADKLAIMEDDEVLNALLKRLRSIYGE